MTSFGRISIAIVTPFVKPTNSSICQIVDEKSLISTIKHVAKGLSNTREILISKSSSNINIDDIIGGIIIPGTTGEQHSLSIEEKKRLYEISAETSSLFNINTLAGVAAMTTFDAIDLAKHAVKVGVKGIMLGLPPYIRCLSIYLVIYRIIYLLFSIYLILYLSLFIYNISIDQQK
jgi:dihydrodipicolinate synthase/N-acetylneuraminate lyase